jgi:hypothetical protein
MIVGALLRCYAQLTSHDHENSIDHERAQLLVLLK